MIGVVTADTVYVKSYVEPKIDMGEVLRYAGVRGDAPELDGMLSACIAELNGRLVYKACWREAIVSCSGSEVDFGFMSVSSAALAKNLSGCDRAVIFAATVGIGIDRLIARYTRISPAKALLFQAIGAERIESLCNMFESDISAKASANGKYTRPRFSPGYGDLPLSAQRDLFAVLDCPKRIGLTLNESLLMSPSKSVTAIIGIRK